MSLKKWAYPDNVVKVFDAFLKRYDHVQVPVFGPAFFETVDLDALVEKFGEQAVEEAYTFLLEHDYVLRYYANAP